MGTFFTGMRRKSFHDGENTFEDLLNSERATPADTCDTIDFEGKFFTLTEVAAAEILPEVLINKSVSGGIKIWKNTQRLADRFDHFYIQERR